MQLQKRENENINNLDQEIYKMRNNFAFNKFINTRIATSKERFDAIIGNNGYIKSSLLKDNLKTTIKDDGTVITQELATVPFVYIQSETISQPNGTKIQINYYPNQNLVPSKIVEYSPQSMITKTTMFAPDGSPKTEERIIRYPDGTHVNELTEFKHDRKTRKVFNIKNITVVAESYVNDNLIYKLECDDNGNIKRESTYYNFTSTPTLHKEITYHSDIAYTEKEYTYTGELCSVVTKKLDKRSFAR